ncbi:MAG: hypothetical protein IIA45_03825 [Bacteroidetes bacterium]|nr:hypothetical protein [Bacteroidota bacterium]
MEEIKDEKQFKRGVNHGYILAKHRPDLLKGILEVNKERNDFIEGLAAGGTEYELQKGKETERIEGLKKIRDVGKSQNKERGY